jgi:hypothetical protein
MKATMSLRNLALAFTLAAWCSACSAGGSSSPDGSSGAGGSAGNSGSSGSGGAAAGSGGAGASGTGATSSGGTGSGGIGSGAAGSGGTSGGGAGSGGAGTGGAGTGGGGTAPLFSDDFEAATLGTSWTERINGGGTFDLTTAQRHGGNQSLHVAVTGFSTFQALEGSPLFPAPSNTFYARVWLYLPGLPTGHVVWLEAGAVANDQHEVRLGMNRDALQINLWQNGEVDMIAPNSGLMANTWHCFELKFGVDELVVWLDGTRVDDVSTTNWVPAVPANGSNQTPKSGWSPTYEAFRIGWELSGGGVSDIWYDDVAVSHAPIGCN